MLRKLSALATCCATLAIGGLIAFAHSPARAQSNICAGLENELARLASLPGGGNSKLAQWDRAIADQTRAVQGTEQKKRRAGCDGSSFLFRRADPVQCKALDKIIRTMRAKLAKMERGRDKAARDPASRSSVDGKIAVIRSQLKQNSCGAPQYRAASRRGYNTGSDGNARILYGPTGNGRIIARISPNSNGVVDARPTRSSGGLFGLLFGGSRQRERVYGNDWGGSFAGTYRTLCVRTCDGYYFPISFSTTEESFSRDSATCSSMCPGTASDARLFIHHNPGQDSSEMISLDGQPYSELENAFRYRTEFDSACTCQAQSTVQVSTAPYESGMIAITTSGDDTLTLYNENPAFEAGVLGPLAALPQPKLAFDEDPDTIANQRGDFSPQKLLQAVKVTSSKTPAQTGEQLAAEANGEVRVVGPEYFVAQ